MSENAKDELALAHSHHCSFLVNMTSDLPNYDRHVNIFGRAVLYAVNTTGPMIETALTTTDSRDLALEQRLINKKVSAFVSHWRTRYDLLLSPGLALATSIEDSRKRLSAIRAIQLQARTATERDRQAIILSWSLPRRFGRRIGLLTVDPKELHPFNDALDALDGWLNATSSQQLVINMIWDKFTRLKQDLDDLAATSFLSDMSFQLGPDGLLEVQSWIKGVETKVRGLGIEGKRVDEEG